MDSLTNSDQNFDSKPKYNLQVITPNPNQPSPKGLQDRMSRQNATSTGSKKGKLIMSVVLVFILVLSGVGGWWYYAYGQAMMMLNQAEWIWGAESGAKNFQQSTSLSLEIKNQNQDTENTYVMLLSGDQFNLDASGDSRVLGDNFESDMKIKLASGDFNLDLGAKIRVVDKKIYVYLDAGSLSELLGTMIPISDFENVWLEMDLENIDSGLPPSYNYNGSITEDQKANMAHIINNAFDELRDRKVFDIKDLKNDANGFRKIQLTPKADKIADIMIVFANLEQDMVELFAPENYGESLDKTKMLDELIENIEKMQTEKPAEWTKIKQMFASVNLVVLINPDNKAIQGFEVYLNNLIIDSGGYKIIINGSFTQLIKAIDYYEISVPDNVKVIDKLEDLFMGSQNLDMMIDDNSNYTLDTDGDQLQDYLEELYGTDKNNPDSDGDGYLDGEEVNNGYNPMGEGALSAPVLFEMPDGSQDYCEYSGGEWTNNNCQCPEGLEFYDSLGCWSSAGHDLDL